METVDLLANLREDEPETYEKLEQELRWLHKAVGIALAEPDDTNSTLVLATFIGSSEILRASGLRHRLLIMMAKSEKAETNGRALLHAMQHLAKPRYRLSSKQRTLLTVASDAISTCWIRTGPFVSFGTELDRELCHMADRLRKQYGLRAI